MNWIEEIPAGRLFLSAVTIGEIQAGIERTREQDRAKAAELEFWLGRVVSFSGRELRYSADGRSSFSGMGSSQAPPVRFAV